MKILLPPPNLTEDEERLIDETKKKKTPKSFSKSKKKKIKKILKKPKAKVPSVSPKKFITMGLKNRPLVTEGKTGYFNEEYMEEKVKWLS